MDHFNVNVYATKIKPRESNCVVDPAPNRYKPLEVPVCWYWSSERVAEWLAELGFQQYSHSFLANSVSGRKLVMVDARNLLTLGVRDLADVRAIAKAIRELLGLPDPPPKWGRSISLPDKDPLEMFLLHKVRTGTDTESLTYDDFVSRDENTFYRAYGIWRPGDNVQEQGQDVGNGNQRD